MLPAHINPKKLYQFQKMPNNATQEVAPGAYCPYLVEKAGDDITQYDPNDCPIYNWAKGLDTYTNPDLKYKTMIRQSYKRHTNTWPNFDMGLSRFVLLLVTALYLKNGTSIEN